MATPGNRAAEADERDARESARFPRLTDDSDQRAFECGERLMTKAQPSRTAEAGAPEAHARAGEQHAERQ